MLSSQVLLCSLYEIYKVLEEELDRNSSHPAVAPIYFPQELDRVEPLKKDRSGVLLRSRLEEEGDRASRHPEIHTETTRGETKINNLLRGVLLIAYNILGVIVEEEYMATYVLAG